jgi:hypothetical protein
LNIAQICAKSPPDAWREMIEDHLENLASITNSGRDSSFEEIRSQLKVRLFNLEMNPGWPLVTAPVCDEFITTLVLDQPTTIATITTDQVDGWGIPVPELFDIAMVNVWEFDAVEVTEFAPEHGFKMKVIESPSFFTTSHILLLDRHLDFDPEKGLIVVIPNRHIVVFVAVETGIERDLELMTRMAKELYVKGPGSITPSLLWLRKGQFEKVDLDRTDLGMEFRGPEQLGRYLQGLE